MKLLKLTMSEILGHVVNIPGRYIDLDEQVEMVLTEPNDDQVGVGMRLSRQVAARIRDTAHHHEELSVQSQLKLEDCMNEVGVHEGGNSPLVIAFASAKFLAFEIEIARSQLQKFVLEEDQWSFSTTLGQCILSTCCRT